MIPLCLTHMVYKHIFYICLIHTYTLTYMGIWYIRHTHIYDSLQASGEASSFLTPHRNAKKWSFRSFHENLCPLISGTCHPSKNTSFCTINGPSSLKRKGGVWECYSSIHKRKASYTHMSFLSLLDHHEEELLNYSSAPAAWSVPKHSPLSLSLFCSSAQETILTLANSLFSWEQFYFHSSQTYILFLSHADLYK